MTHLTQNQVVLRISLIIAGFEFLIMMLLQFFQLGLNVYLEAVFDTILLATFSTPVFYLWVIKPFVDGRDEALAQVNQLAYSDSLTGLGNRRSIMKSLGRTIASSIRHQEFAAVLLIDLDGFKRINDDHGHEAGDEVLVTVAGRLQSVVRFEDAVGRLGGDEFIVLVNHLGADEHAAHDNATIVVKKLLDLVNQPIEFGDKTLCVGASIGVRLIGGNKLGADAAISDADHAMYRAKKYASKERFCFAKNTV